MNERNYSNAFDAPETFAVGGSSGSERASTGCQRSAGRASEGVSTAIDATQRIFGDYPETSEERYYDLLNEISIAIVEYRMARGMSQAALADALGVSRAMVSKYESGEYNISLKAAVELFSKLNIPFDFKIGAPSSCTAPH